VAAAGWTDVAWRDLTGGIVALHHAIKTPSFLTR
jgi:demethylmenaquinone methyltransferase/2-methoxy-6-polyprenyl-1,4-benzoquinol methylase